MARKVLIGYDHSEISNNAMEWIVKKKAILPDDNITVVTIVNDDAIAVEGTFGLESTLVGPAAWMADDYRERVSQIEKDSTDALKSVVNWFSSKGVSIVWSTYVLFFLCLIQFVYTVHCDTKSA
jgi:hypothetical protein